MAGSGHDRVTRRAALGLLGGSVAALGLGEAHADLVPEILGAAQDASGNFRIGLIDAAFGEAEGAPAPLRLHALCPRSDGRECVAVARRPGDLALVLDGAGSRVRATFRASEGRRFSGHGVYRDDGRTFLSTEIDVATGDGVIVIRDVAGGYAVRGEFRSAGVGPHELVSTGRLIAVANGAKEPKGDPGIAALDGARALSNLALIDPVTGVVENVAELGGGGLETLSLRHLATLPEGGVLVAAQDREASVRDRPLVARLDGGRLRPFDEALEATPLFAGYVGSLAVDRSGRFAAASSPKGGVVAAFDVVTGKVIGSVAAPDVCGLAPAREPAGFVATSGLGDVLRIAVDVDGCAIVARRAGALRWDNHLAALAPPTSGER
ncbi:DUF1513 domain-containing protein [Hansschlegelia zhihuaiae]|uniref:DUF1513 domain-containing protein n=1 Tax=Hansschlegelia zhihuaiae TaxID=405005 RepID=A0A4Q0MMM6_9HYPH|nr:DUF1513 domain-containing protein [Hansschlegelia zhihuaiae]RXF74984.1 DUF1513 domain-containing protein [Hansschlegelia zhihuaiae]